jgi:DNA recombination protein RmuC
VKAEFGRFGTWLEKIQRQLQTASHTLAETGTRTRAMERRLRGVEQLEPADSATLLPLPGLPELGALEEDVPPTTAEDTEGAG